MASIQQIGTVITYFKSYTVLKVLRLTFTIKTLLPTGFVI